jgi:glutathione S-transferase
MEELRAEARLWAQKAVDELEKALAEDRAQDTIAVMALATATQTARQLGLVAPDPRPLVETVMARVTAIPPGEDPVWLGHLQRGAE